MVHFNPFRYAADIVHVISILLLLYKIYRSKSADGISLKTQVLYGIVFTGRYVGFISFIIFYLNIDLFWNWKNLYNVSFKIFYLVTSALMIFLIGVKYRSFIFLFIFIFSLETYRLEYDNFKIIYVLIPALILGVIFNDNHKSWFEYVYAVSLFLESVSILPQVFSFFLVRS
jgi:ER lumen protein retaining receptor